MRSRFSWSTSRRSTRTVCAIGARKRAARPYWQVLIDLYRAADEPDAKNALAVTLSDLVTRATLPEYIECIRDEANGPSRVAMVRALKRMRDPRGRAVLDELLEHPVLGQEARRAVAGRSRNS